MTAKTAAPWVRTRLRTAPGAACALGLLVLLTAFLAAALPRGTDAYEDRGLRHTVASAAPENTVLRLAAAPPPPEDPGAVGPRRLAEDVQRSYDTLRAPLRVDRDQSAYGLRTTDKVIADSPLDSWLARPEGLPPRLMLATRSALADHARLTAGRLPSAKPSGAATAQAAVTAATAKALHIKPGSVLHLPGAHSGEVTVTVTGIVEPLKPSASYWATASVLHQPQLVPQVPGQPDAPRYWYAGLLVGDESAATLLNTAGAPELYADIAPDTAAMTARGLAALTASVAAVEGGPTLAEIRGQLGGEAVVNTQLDAVFAQFSAVRDSIGPVVAVASFGTATVAGVVLLMAGGLATARRGAELTLLRARGGSLRGIGARLAAETAVVVLPAAALGLGLAVLVIRSGRLGPALLAVAVVAAVSTLALPVRAMLAHRTVRSAADRADLVRVRPSRRRTVAELTLLVLAVGAVVALRRRSTEAGSDSLVSSAPVLVGVISALVLVRLYPLPLRWAARPAARLRGTVGFLSLARAGRAPGGGVLPLLALLTALTTAAFGGSVLAGVADARDRAALYTTGADARIETAALLPKDLPGRVAKVAGVSLAVPARIDYSVDTPYGDRITVVGAEPGAYARLADRTGLGPFAPGDLTAGAKGAALPALASPRVAAGLGRGPRDVVVAGYRLTVRVVAVRAHTPAVPRGDFLLVDSAALGAKAPTALLVDGKDVDAARLRRVVKTSSAGSTSAPTVQLLSETRARLVDSPLQTGAERVYTAAVAAGAGYAALALMLSLLRGAPERSALLARLRTMGLTRRQGRRLLVLESLPQAVLAAVGGALTGWAAIELLAPGVNLTGLALAASPAQAVAAGGLRTDALSLLVPAGCVVVLTTAVAATQAWWTSRRGSVTELRAGDAR
ncbi:FtsX-like permease family protein [Streptomyces sp. NPDC059070]|uniref:FtsX-like permease family protein n=1 Tax=Streptomyces sp. NPDC059070 TaxID=3346713 RepID=UPI0036C3622A